MCREWGCGEVTVVWVWTASDGSGGVVKSVCGERW